MPNKFQSALNQVETHYLTYFPGEFAKSLLALEHKDCYQVIKKHSRHDISLLFQYLPPSFSAEVILFFPLKQRIDILTDIDTQLATEMIKVIDLPEAQQIIENAPPSLATTLNEALTYAENSAGKMMDRRILRFTADMTVKAAIAKLKKFPDRNYRVIFITDEQDHLTHYVPIQDLLFANQNDSLFDLQKRIITFVRDVDNKTTIQEQLEKYKLTDIPVVDANGKFLGVIRYRTLFASIKEAALSDMQSMVGASPDESATSKISVVVRKRLPWLQFNLLTAFLAAFVVGIFEPTIAKYTALAVLLPIVAGQSGNTGAQALAVTMRGLVLKEIYSYQWKRVVLKEAVAGFINGLVVAITTSICIFFWSQSFGLGVIIFSSMIISMMLAAMAGALTPIMLNKFGLDPAQSSSIILTTITDVTGFFCFLGIATALIALLPT